MPKPLRAILRAWQGGHGSEYRTGAVRAADGFLERHRARARINAIRSAGFVTTRWPDELNCVYGYYAYSPTSRFRGWGVSTAIPVREYREMALQQAYKDAREDMS